MGYTLKLTIAYEAGEDRWVIASIPEVRGVHSQGRTREEPESTCSTHCSWRSRPNPASPGRARAAALHARRVKRATKPQTEQGPPRRKGMPGSRSSLGPLTCPDHGAELPDPRHTFELVGTTGLELNP